jgi:hypothetical protein
MRKVLVLAIAFLLPGCQQRPVAVEDAIDPTLAGDAGTSAESASPLVRRPASSEPFTWPRAVKTRELLLHTGLFAPEWAEISHNGKQVAVAIETLPTDGESYIDVYAYVFNRYFREWRQFIAVKIRNAGTVELEHDEQTGSLAIIGRANNDLNGARLLSFDLRAVSDDRAAPRAKPRR